MNGMLFAERTILFQLQPLGVVLFILHIVVISVLAFGALERDLGSVDGSHFPKNSVQKNHTSGRCVSKVYHKVFALSIVFARVCAIYLPRKQNQPGFFRKNTPPFVSFWIKPRQNSCIKPHFRCIIAPKNRRAAACGRAHALPYIIYYY